MLVAKTSFGYIRNLYRYEVGGEEVEIIRLV